MKSLVINLIGKLAGAGKLLAAVGKSKGYLAGASMMLLALSGATGDVAKIMEDGLTLAELLEFAKGFTKSSDFKLFLEGLAVVGIRHGVAKAAK